jgi:hypothetical protein
MRIIYWLTSVFGRKSDGVRINAGHSGMVLQENERFIPACTQRRRYPRFTVEGIGIRLKMIFVETIKISDIGVGGACIIVRRTLNPGSKVLMRMNSEKIQRPLLGTVVWEKRGNHRPGTDGTGPFPYRVGIQFKEVSPETRLQLKDFMGVSEMPEEKTHANTYELSAIRYRAPRDEGAVLNYPATYIVKKISLSGMLVDTNCQFEVEQRYPMALFLPNESDPVKFSGRVASQISLPGGNSFATGIEFCNLSEHDGTRLKKSIVGLLLKNKTAVEYN